MKPGATDTLFYPVTSGMIAPPETGRGLFVNAGLPADHQTSSEPWFKSLVAVQHDRAAWLELDGHGIPAHRSLGTLGDDSFAMAFVRLGKHRGENETMIANTSGRLEPSVPILVAGHKTDGVTALRKRLTALAGTGQAPQAVAKYHGQVLIFENHAGLADLRHEPRQIDSGFETAPGMFSKDHPDTASQLLARVLPSMEGKRVADFGAGWGYLSVRACTEAKPAAISLYESHWPSLEAAMANLNRHCPGIDATAHWHDLAREAVPRRYDTIIMNPPFHQGRETRRSLGEAFIRRASDALVPGGRLWMVANTSLAYEPVLAACFAGHEEVAREGGFKVLAARR